MPIQFQVVATPAKGSPISATANFNRVISRGFARFPALLGLVIALIVVLAAAAVLLGVFTHGNANGSNALARSATATQTSAAAVPTQAPTAVATSLPTATPLPTASPVSQAPLVVRRVTTDKPQVALTFSLASDVQAPAKLQTLLGILADQGVKATFGFRGDWAEAHPDLVRAIVAGGHQLIDETYDHQSFTGASTTGKPLTSAQRIDELKHDAQIIKQISGVDMEPYYRPPYGDVDTGDSTSVATDAAKAGYSVAVLWSIDTESWANGRTVNQMVTAAGKAQPGDVILFNITLAGGNKDAQALPQIITDLRAKGFAFVTVKQLVGR
jgi:peptidoglycan/xylan/chitin deacetylase (PgdA/CDA1 family)